MPKIGSHCYIGSFKNNTNVSSSGAVQVIPVESYSTEHDWGETELDRTSSVRGLLNAQENAGSVRTLNLRCKRRTSNIIELYSRWFFRPSEDILIMGRVPRVLWRARRLAFFLGQLLSRPPAKRTSSAFSSCRFPTPKLRVSFRIPP